MPFHLRDVLPFSGSFGQSFKFLDPGPLRDDELELVAPEAKWINAVLAACRHPMSIRQSAGTSEPTQRQLMDFVDSCPGGRQEPDPGNGVVPAYHFWMHVTNDPELPIAGGLGLRITNNYDTVKYVGHIGYHVYPPSRGHHYAERACRLVFPLAAKHGINPLWITCNPDNAPSRRTCERLGGVLVEIVPVPEDHSLYQRGDKQKCRYRFDL